MALTKQQGDRRFGLVSTVPGLVLVGALAIYPVIYNVYVSFRTFPTITHSTYTGLDNYVWLFTARFSDFFLSWKVSLLYSLGSASAALLLGLLLAHLLYGLPRRLRGPFRTVSVLPWAAPLVVSAFMWQWILARDVGILNFFLDTLGLVDEKPGWVSSPQLALLSGIFATVWRRTPFTMLLALAGLESIDRQLFEAADTDGASAWQKFVHIALPLNRHQLVVAFIIVWMFTFRTPDVFFALTGGGPGKATYHAGVYLIDLIYHFLKFGRAGALGILLFLTVAVVAAPILYYGIIKPSQSGGQR